MFSLKYLGLFNFNLLILVGGVHANVIEWITSIVFVSLAEMARADLTFRFVIIEEFVSLKASARCTRKFTRFLIDDFFRVSMMSGWLQVSFLTEQRYTLLDFIAFCFCRDSFYLVNLAALGDFIFSLYFRTDVVEDLNDGVIIPVGHFLQYAYIAELYKLLVYVVEISEILIWFHLFKVRRCL